MNILIFSSNSPYYEITKSNRQAGGAETNLRLIAEKLKSLNHEILYFSTEKGEKKKRINGVNVYHNKLFYIPFFHKYFPIIKIFNNKFLTIQTTRKINKIVKENNIDIIHTYATYPDTYIALKISRENDIPIVQRIAGRSWYNLIKNKPEFYNEIKFTLENVDYQLFVSEPLRKITFKYMVESDININKKNEILFSGFDFNKIKNINNNVISKYNINKNDLLILSIGSFKNYSKRQDLLINSMLNIKNQFDNIKLIFIGTGKKLHSMKKLTHKLELDDVIEFIGNITHEEVLMLIKRSKIVVHITEFEGLSNVLVETMSLGKPIIASNISPLNDIIKDRYNGLLTENQPNKIAECIVFLLKNSELQKEISRNAYIYAKKNFDIDTIIVKLEKIFFNLIKNYKNIKLK